jgi:ribosome-binding factor A
MASRRAAQLGNVLQVELADLISRRAKDPRLTGLITITGVKLSDDLKQARVFFCLMGAEQTTPKRKREVEAGLASSSGFLKRELSKRLRLRHPPELSFSYDDSFDYAGRIDRLLKEIHEDDPGDREGSAGS